MLKITALENVRIFGNVVTQKTVEIGGHFGQKPINSYQWVSLKKGEVCSSMSAFLGIDPKYLPGEDVEFLRQTEYVPFRNGQASQSFQALVQVE